MLQDGLLHLVVFAFICLRVLALGAVNCPYEACHCSAAHIDCTNRGLLELPPLNPGAFSQVTLDISRNKISAIGDGELPAGLRSIVSVNNPLTSISGGAFKDSTETLVSLVLANGQLKSVPDAVGSLKSVHTIILRGNQIDDMSPLFSLPALRNVDMRDNKLANHEHIPKALTPHTNSLKILNLGQNSLTQIPNLSFLTGLDTLYLDSNDLSEAPSGVLPISVKHLYLDNVNLGSVPSSIASLPKLQLLYLTQNNIKSVDGVEFPASLHTLDLAENEIETFSGLTFVGGSPQLVDLHLSDSPLKTITEDAFDNIPTLRRLFTSRTKLERLPLALTALPNLKNLFLEDIPTLACTCEESGLSSWITDRPYIMVYGDCGDSEIKSFLLNLATQCPS